MFKRNNDLDLTIAYSRLLSRRLGPGRGLDALVLGQMFYHAQCRIGNSTHFAKSVSEIVHELGDGWSDYQVTCAIKRLEDDGILVRGKRCRFGQTWDRAALLRWRETLLRWRETLETGESNSEVATLETGEPLPRNWVNEPPETGEPITQKLGNQTQNTPESTPQSTLSGIYDAAPSPDGGRAVLDAVAHLSPVNFQLDFATKVAGLYQDAHGDAWLEVLRAAVATIKKPGQAGAYYYKALEKQLGVSAESTPKAPVAAAQWQAPRGWPEWIPDWPISRDNYQAVAEWLHPSGDGFTLFNWGLSCPEELIERGKAVGLGLEPRKVYFQTMTPERAAAAIRWHDALMWEAEDVNRTPQPTEEDLKEPAFLEAVELAEIEDFRRRIEEEEKRRAERDQEEARRASLSDAARLREDLETMRKEYERKMLDLRDFPLFDGRGGLVIGDGGHLPWEKPEPETQDDRARAIADLSSEWECRERAIRAEIGRLEYEEIMRVEREFWRDEEQTTEAKAQPPTSRQLNPWAQRSDHELSDDAGMPQADGNLLPGGTTAGEG